MEFLSRLELLQPETQTLIMCHISCAKTLYSLLRASPRFYQVFISRREYHLTQLAIGNCPAPANAWDAIKASRLPKSALSRHEDVEHFVRTFTKDHDYTASVLSLEISIPMIKVRMCVEWFVADFAKDALSNLVSLGELESLTQNLDKMHRELSTIESGRIARAFFRFETFRHLFSPLCSVDRVRIIDSQLAVAFLYVYELDEIEELVCIRDYIIRRLWSIFDRIEDDFARERSLQPRSEAAQVSSDDDWFGVDGKEQHEYYMENLISLGLPFLQEVLTADRARSTELVLSNSVAISDHLTDAIEKIADNYIESIESDRDNAEDMRNYNEDLTDCSYGWHWGKDLTLNIVPGNSRRKGCRDWGYVFWEKSRLKAADVLYRSYFPPKCPRSSTLADQRLNRASMIGYHCLFEDTNRGYEPCAMLRLKDPQVS